MLRIKLVSDIHLEFSDIHIKNDQQYDVLILAGDIMIAEDLHDHPDDATLLQASILDSLGKRQQSAIRYRDFLKRCSSEFKHVIAVAGNHELYHGKWVRGIQTLRDEYSKFHNAHFLENDYVVIDDVVFIGCTLWTDCNKADPVTLHSLANMMNDFSVIKNDEKGFASLRPANILSRHRKSLEYLSETIPLFNDKKVVVVTHHAPSKLSTHPRYASDFIMNGGYSSDLSEFILDHENIVQWCHGHTHHPFDYTIGNTRIVCNPRGYESPAFSEDTNWDPNIKIEI